MTATTPANDARQINRAIKAHSAARSDYREEVKWLGASAACRHLKKAARRAARRCVAAELRDLH